MPSCKEATRLYSHSRDEHLPLIDRIGLLLHLKMCSLCARYARQIDWIEKRILRFEKTDHVLPKETAKTMRRTLNKAMEAQNKKK